MPAKLSTLAEISADILALEQETEGLLSEITGANRPMTLLIAPFHSSSDPFYDKCCLDYASRIRPC